MGTAVLPTDENSAIEIRPDDIPKSKRDEEVDQSEEDEAAEDHLDDEATCGASGRVKISADATNYEADSESLKNIRLANYRIEDEASVVTVCFRASALPKDLIILPSNQLNFTTTSRTFPYLCSKRIPLPIDKTTKAI